MLRFEIPFDPIAKRRPRFFRKGNHVGTYDEQKIEKHEVRNCLEKQLHHVLMDLKNDQATEALKSLYEECYYVVHIHFLMPIPSSWSNKKKNLALWGQVAHMIKPDLDNLAKFYLDCANDLIWDDDAQIHSLTLTKRYSKNPKTIMEIRPMTSQAHKRTQEVLSLMDPEELTEMLKQLTETIDFFDEGDARTTALLLEKFAESYSPTLQKIFKVKQKYDKIDGDLDNCERVQPWEGDQDAS